MMRLYTVMLVMFLFYLLSACGGGGDSDTDSAAVAPDPVTPIPPLPAPLQTADIQAQASFDFRIDNTITIHVDSAPPSRGIINIYYSTAFYDQELGKYYPDYSSLIASWRPSIDIPYSVSFNKNWPGLLFEWIPESAEHTEKSYYFEKEALADQLYLNL